MKCPICNNETIKNKNQTYLIYCSDECKKKGKQIKNKYWYEKNRLRLQQDLKKKYPNIREEVLLNKKKRYDSDINYKERVKQKARERYYNKKELIKTKVNDYRKKNKNEINNKKIIWAKETGYHKSYYEQNADKKKKYKKEYLKTENGRLKTIIWNANRRAMRNNVIHEFTKKEWDLKLKNSKGFCKICNNYIGINKLTLDHIYPISKANEDYKNTKIKKIYQIKDVQPICKSCNSSKKDNVSHKDSWRHSKPSSNKIAYMFDPPNGNKTRDTTYASIWSYRGYKKIPIIDDPIHNIDSVNSLRGKYYSRFSPLTAECIINYWSNPGDLILDPFSGRTRAIVSSLKERNYIGFEISKEVYTVMKLKIDEGLKQKELPEEYAPRIIHDDCLNLSKHNIPQVDFVFTCPPYFNLEKYESCEGQLSDENDYSTFLSQLKQRLSKSCELLKDEGYAAIVIGDFRRDGKFYILHNEILNMMQSLNMDIHDIIILQTVTWDVATYRFGSVKRSKKVSKVHEYLLIFKKQKSKNKNQH